MNHQPIVKTAASGNTRNAQMNPETMRTTRRALSFVLESSSTQETERDSPAPLMRQTRTKKTSGSIISKFAGSIPMRRSREQHLCVTPKDAVTKPGAQRQGKVPALIHLRADSVRSVHSMLSSDTAVVSGVAANNARKNRHTGNMAAVKIDVDLDATGATDDRRGNFATTKQSTLGPAGSNGSLPRDGSNNLSLRRRHAHVPTARELLRKSRGAPATKLRARFVGYSTHRRPQSFNVMERPAPATAGGGRSAANMKESISSPDLRKMAEYGRDYGFRRRFFQEFNDGGAAMSGTCGPTRSDSDVSAVIPVRRLGSTGSSSRFVSFRNGNDSIDEDGDEIVPQSPALNVQQQPSTGEVTTVKLDDIIVQVGNHHLVNFLRRERRYRWLSSFRKLDPRYQILTFFNDVSREGGNNVEKLHLYRSLRAIDPLLRGFVKASAFSVWRPTSSDSILKMMRGDAVGKGLDVKGKSAKCGMLSGYIPFVQIHEEDHKRQVRRSPRDGRMRIYYRSRAVRDKAMKNFSVFATQAAQALDKARQVIDAGEEAATPELWEQALLDRTTLDVADCTAYTLDGFASENAYGIDLPQRHFFVLCIKNKDISRPSGSDLETGRVSQPAFQDMNFACTRSCKGKLGKAVVLQMAEDAADDPLRPQTLVVAYEENCRVMPVCSDFDCFLVGTRKVSYDDPLPTDQVGMMINMIDEINTILDGPSSSDSWTGRWLDVLKKNAKAGDKPGMPQYGYGDAKSYRTMEAVARRLKSTSGAVRHGAECFNFVFPQDIDDHFLVVCDSLPGAIPWKYVGVRELQDILLRRVDEGHTFPLNPKWVICDPGWKRVWDKLMSSDDECTQKSLDMWYPPSSGIRDKIEAIYQRHPNGFQQLRRPSSIKESIECTEKAYNRPGNVDEARAPALEGTEAMDLAEQELKYHLILKRAKMKLRVALMFMNLTDSSSSLEEAGNRKMEPPARRTLAGKAVSLVVGSW